MAGFDLFGGSLFKPKNTSSGSSVGSGIARSSSSNPTRSVGTGYYNSKPSYSTPKPTYQAPVQTYNAPASSYSSGGGSDSSASFATQAAAAPPEPPPPPPPVMETIVIPDAEADTGYQKTVADLARAAVDFKAQQGLARNQYDSAWGEAKRRMGWDESGGGKFNRNIPGAFGESIGSNENDFAGRGMYWSGAHGQAVSDINRDFADRKSTLDTGRKNDWDTQQMALSSFTGNQDAVKNAARTDALAKLAAQYGLNMNEVPWGSTKTIQREKV